MLEAIISTEQVRATTDGNAVKVIATLDAGEIVAGMFLHIPLNGMLNFVVRIKEVIPQGANQLLLILDCDNDPEDTLMVMAFNFAEETLWVLEDAGPAHLN